MKGLKLFCAIFCALFVVQSAQAQIVINEIMATNQNGLQDDWFENDDWLELYNSGSITNLAGYYLSDDLDSLDKWQFPNTNAGLTTILPNNHLLIWIDKDPEQGEDHADFKLSGDGETVFFVDPDGETILDSITYGVQQADISFGRICDGCEDWIFFNNTTPDDENQEILPEPQLLFINEVLVDNYSDVADLNGEHDAWFEVYNPNDFQVNLGGYYISNTSDNLQYQIPLTNPVLTTVDANGFQLFWCDSQTEQGENHVPIELSANGSLKLTGTDEVEIDEYAYYETATDVSYGRASDGALSSIEFETPTPRVTNSLIIIEPAELYINEVLTDNVSDTTDTNMQTEDWFEIYNPGPDAVDIGGYFVTDNIESPMKFQIPVDHPDSSIIPAGGYLLFWCDEDQSQGWNHVNFKLRNNEEQLILRSPDGFSIADEISWTNQLDDISFGRQTDGMTPWILFSETTPEYSNNGATVGVEEVKFGSTSVYPNPFTTSIVVDYSGFIRIFGIAGDLIHAERIAGPTNINLNHLSKGMYFILNEEGETTRIVKN